MSLDFDMILLKPQKYLWIYNKNVFCDIENKKDVCINIFVLRGGSL